jgi:hypothetical protein
VKRRAWPWLPLWVRQQVVWRMIERERRRHPEYNSWEASNKVCVRMREHGTPVPAIWRCE